VQLTRDAPAETGSIRRIAEQVWRIVAPNPSVMTGPGTNTYVVGSVAPVVIDPGPDDPAHLSRILEVTGSPVSRIVCTHSHPDHSPGAAPLSRRTGAPVCGRPAPDDGHQDRSYAPVTLLEDGDVIDAGDLRIRVVHTPGHASNHVCLLLDDCGLLFTGDHLMSGSTVVILPPDGSMREYLISLRRLGTMQLGAIAPGHGAVIPDAHREIERVIAHRLARETKLVDALRQRGPATLDDVLPQVYDDVPKSLHGWARYSLLAHAIKLVEEGSAVQQGDRYLWLGDDRTV
jgi:glyoxylase-like metal-dependent hydrolase (beta-lactamase superfamily II)